MYPPECLGDLLYSLPINPTVDSWACLFFGLFCFSALVGFHTRKSSLAAAVLGIYTMGIPQMYGKVGHMAPPLIWFAFILAACDCAKVLSVYATIKAWKLARPDVEPNTYDGVRYG